MQRDSLKQKFLLYRVRQAKDAQAYAKLYDYYVERIFRFILFKVSSQEVAEDLTSEVFLKTWEYINTTKKKIENLNALLYKIARNTVVDYYRKKKQEALRTDEEIMKNIQDARNMEAETNERLELQALEKHLMKLKDIYREVIILRFVEDFSISEIAEMLDRGKGNVRVLLHRALEALKEIAGEK